MRLATILFIMLTPAWALAQGVPGTSSSPTAGPAAFDYSQLTLEKAQRIVDAWPKVAAWISKNQTTASDYERATAGKDQGQIPSALLTWSKGIPDQEKFEQEIGIKADEFFQGQTLMSMAYGGLIAREEAGKSGCDFAAQKKEMEDVLKDPNIPPEVREQVKQQFQAAEKSLSQASQGMNVPEPALKIAEKFRSQIESWMKWNPGGTSNPKPDSSPDAGGTGNP